MVHPVTGGFWRKNGVKNGLRIAATTHFVRGAGGSCAGLRGPVVRQPWIINRLIYTMATRPPAIEHHVRRLHVVGLVARQTFGGVQRHLSDDPALQEPPPEVGDVIELFRATGGRARRVSPRSPRCCFPTVRAMVRRRVSAYRSQERSAKNKSTHEIDLSQLYGQTQTSDDNSSHGAAGRGSSSQPVHQRPGVPALLLRRGWRGQSEFKDLAIVYPGTTRSNRHSKTEDRYSVDEVHPSQKTEALRARHSARQHPLRLRR